MTGEEALRQLGGGDWKGALGILADHYGRGTSRTLAGVFGVTTREVQRWKVAAGLSEAEEKRSAKKHENKLMAMAAALRLRGMAGANVDKITVTYDHRDIGDRHIAHITGFLNFGQGRMYDAREAAADALDRGDFTGAAEALAAGFLDEYGGLGGDLGISDYDPGIGWEE